MTSAGEDWGAPSVPQGALGVPTRQKDGGRERGVHSVAYADFKARDSRALWPGPRSRDRRQQTAPPSKWPLQLGLQDEVKKQGTKRQKAGKAGKSMGGAVECFELRQEKQEHEPSL